MKAVQQLLSFLEASSYDARLTPAHIALYASLLYHWHQHQYRSPITIHRALLMHMSKLSGRATYNKCMQDLHQFGYIQYQPSFNHIIGSLVYLHGFPECVAKIQLQPKKS